MFVAGLRWLLAGVELLDQMTNDTVLSQEKVVSAVMVACVAMKKGVSIVGVAVMVAGVAVE